MTVRLRAARPSDYPEILRWRRQSRILRYTPILRLDLAGLRRKLSGDVLHWIVEADGRAAGTITGFNVNRRMGTVELGYQLDQAVHGRGLGTAAVALAVPRLLKRFRRVIAHVSADNLRSRRLLERLGFKLEGVLRKHFKIQGRLVDQCFYGLLRSDWRSPKIPSGTRSLSSSRRTPPTRRATRRKPPRSARGG